MKSLEEVIKDKALLTSTFKYIKIYSSFGHNFNIEFDTDISFEDILINDDNEKMYEILKPFIYYLYSFTYNIKFVRDHILLMDKISYSYYDEERNNEFDHTLYFYKHGDFWI